MRIPNFDDVDKEGRVSGGIDGIKTYLLRPVKVVIRKHAGGRDLCLISDGPGIYYETRMPLEEVAAFIETLKEAE